MRHIFIIPEEKLPENLEETLIDGMRRIIALCEEGILEIKEVGIQSNRTCDILAEEIPEKSNELFKLILRGCNIPVQYPHKFSECEKR